MHTNLNEEIEVHTTTDYLSYLAIGAGFLALVAFLWWAGVVADALIGLIEMV
jgi:hypothetical protein